MNRVLERWVGHELTALRDDLASTVRVPHPSDIRRRRALTVSALSLGAVAALAAVVPAFVTTTPAPAAPLLAPSVTPAVSVPPAAGRLPARPPFLAPGPARPGPRSAPPKAAPPKAVPPKAAPPRAVPPRIAPPRPAPPAPPARRPAAAVRSVADRHDRAKPHVGAHYLARRDA